ncbi:MAG TPA: M20 family metallopeptidase [Ktedonobacteraceae bacterium]|nr:M20 family metallopeptidase [Ktedonobacteraceae bacterium]
MHSFAQIYLPKLKSYQIELLQRLELLVNIDSGTGQIDGINSIISFLEQWLSDIGFDVTLHDSTGYGNNLVVRKKGRGHLRLLLVGHVDTVYPPGAAAAQPFHIRDGIAYGPGVIDMKSGDLMGLYALQALIESGFEEYKELIFVFNNDEEVGSTGSAPLLREIARHVDLGLVLESSRSIEFVTRARKGAEKYELEVVGVPAHSGAEPNRGRSAVIELAHKMIAIHHLNSMFPGVTFNVTRISSSEPLNVIPDSARCHISVRAFNQRGLDLASAALNQIAAGCSIPDTHTRLTRTRGRIAYEATPQVMRLVEIAQSEAQGLGFELISETKGGVSDANLLMEVGVPTLDSLGPIGGGMHDLNREHLRIDSIPLRGALLAGLIHNLCLSESTG